MAHNSAKALHSSLSKLQISQEGKVTATVKDDELADSWEDEVGEEDEEDEEDSSDTETEMTPPASANPVSLKPVYGSSYDAPAPPPPTPSSPSFAPHMSKSSPYNTFPPYGLDGAADDDPRTKSSTRLTRVDGEQKRPEKTTKVAQRLIAAGIGQKPARRTEEERKYDQAMRVQVKKERDKVKAEEERKKAETEKAKKEIWAD